MSIEPASREPVQDLLAKGRAIFTQRHEAAAAEKAEQDRLRELYWRTLCDVATEDLGPKLSVDCEALRQGPPESFKHCLDHYGPTTDWTFEIKVLGIGTIARRYHYASTDAGDRWQATTMHNMSWGVVTYDRHHEYHTGEVRVLQESPNHWHYWPTLEEALADAEEQTKRRQQLEAEDQELMAARQGRQQKPRELSKGEILLNAVDDYLKELISETE